MEQTCLGEELNDAKRESGTAYAAARKTECTPRKGRLGVKVTVEVPQVRERCLRRCCTNTWALSGIWRSIRHVWWGGG